MSHLEIHRIGFFGHKLSNASPGEHRPKFCGDFAISKFWLSPQGIPKCAPVDAQVVSNRLPGCIVTSSLQILSHVEEYLGPVMLF
jgi:hypothetical protein